MAVDIDGILEAIGEFGPYQRKIYFLLCLPVIFVGAANLSYVFIAASPNYRCYVQGCDEPLNENAVYDEPFLNFTIPRNNKTGEYEYCYEYARIKNDSSRPTCFAEDFFHKNELCKNGVVFDKSIYQSTVVTEELRMCVILTVCSRNYLPCTDDLGSVFLRSFGRVDVYSAWSFLGLNLKVRQFNLTCSESWQASIDQSVYFGGMLVGALLFGILSDMFGRRITILVGIVIMAISGVTIALVPNLFTFHVMRFVNAMASSGVFQTVFVLGMELVGPGKRVMFGIVGEYFFALGEILLGTVAYTISSWRMLQLLISAPVLCFIFYYWIIPESIRWLQAKGRHFQVVGALEKMAKVNKKTIPLHLLRHQTISEVNEETDDDLLVLRNNDHLVTVLDLLKSLTMTLRTVFMIVMWMTTTLTYYGLSYYSSSLQTNSGAAAPYVNFILSAIAEMPGYTIAWIGMVYGGRRISLIISLFISAIACGATGFLEGRTMILLGAFMIGKCFITSAFAIIYVYTAEMFPTSLRNTIVGACSMFARIGGMAAPFSTSLRSVFVPLPMIIFGSLSLLSSLLTLYMPETLNTKLPDTILEAINLGKRSPDVVYVSSPQPHHEDESERLLDDCSGSDTEPIS